MRAVRNLRLIANLNCLLTLWAWGVVHKAETLVVRQMHAVHCLLALDQFFFSSFSIIYIEFAHVLQDGFPEQGMEDACEELFPGAEVVSTKTPFEQNAHFFGQAFHRFDLLLFHVLLESSVLGGSFLSFGRGHGVLLCTAWAKVPHFG